MYTTVWTPVRPQHVGSFRGFPADFSNRQRNGSHQAYMRRGSVCPCKASLTLEPPSRAERAAQQPVFTEEDHRNLLSGYRSQYVEHDYWITEDMVEGQIPAELEGTLLRNGPGLFEVGGMSLSQPLDGDGMVVSFAFKDGRCFFRNRFVRTEAFLKEQEAQKLLYRGAFSVGNPSGGFFFNPFDFSVKGIANTGVLHWGGKLLALYERDLPYQLDMELQTLGRTDLDGTIDTPKLFFGAHYRVMGAEAGNKRLVGFNFAEEPTFALLHFFEYDEDFKLLHKTRWELPGASFGFFHDFLVTPSYYVLLENPIQMNFGKLLTKYMLGQACLAECLEFMGSKPTVVHLIPRPDQAAAGVAYQKFETEGFFSFHHVNAFEVPGEGLVVVDTAAADGIDFSASFENASADFFKVPSNGRSQLTRLVLNKNTGQVQRHVIDPEFHSELPSINWANHGLPHQHMYSNQGHVPGPPFWSPLQDVVKTSLPPQAGVTQPFSRDLVQRDVWSPGRDSFAQEPIFVAREGGASEDDGWVLSVVYHAPSHTTDLVILDALCMSAGPLARIRLPHHIPLGIHGSFTPQYLGPTENPSGERNMYNILNGVQRDGRLQYRDA